MFGMESGGIAWLMAIGLGAVILGLGLFYGIRHTRKNHRQGTPTQDAQDRGTRAAYGHTETRRP